MLAEAWNWLQGPGGPIANLLQIVGTAIGVAGFMWGVTYSWFRRRLKSDRARISRLEEDLSHRTEQLDRNMTRVQQLEAACSRLPENIVLTVSREIDQLNRNKAHYVTTQWLEREGESISAILRFETEWAILHATGDAHFAGFVVAEAFAAAAHALWPHDTSAAELAEELRRLRDAERGEANLSFQDASSILAVVDPNRYLDARAVGSALALEQDALTLESGSFFRLALLKIEVAVEILSRELGNQARPSLRTRITRVRLLLWVGSASRALGEAENIVALSFQLFGLQHPDTLVSRTLLAQALGRLGRRAEALPVIEDVAREQAASPDLGPQHPTTLTSRSILAQVLLGLGRAAEALPVIEDVAREQAASPDLGPQHPHTLTSRSILSQVLLELRRKADALPVVEDVARAQAASPDLGPQHPDTLASRFRLAQVLLGLGRPADALPVIEDVARAQVASPDLGPQHPHTLASRSLLAQVLGRLGRPADALPVIEDVARAQAASPDLGPQHPHTLASQYLLARVLGGLGRLADALPVIEGVAQKRVASPDLGLQHPITLESRSFLAQVLVGLGRAAEALPIIEDVARAQAASPDLGPQHPDTLASRFRLAQALVGLGRRADALPVIEDVARAQAASPDLGPQHPHTLASRSLLAQVLNKLAHD